MCAALRYAPVVFNMLLHVLCEGVNFRYKEVDMPNRAASCDSFTVQESKCSFSLKYFIIVFWIMTPCSFIGCYKCF
jgi:hypothetical protein